jgi:hypothetical protein
MQTAIEYDPYSSMFYLTSAISESKVIALPASAVTATAVGEDKEMTSPSMWQDTQDPSSPSNYSRSSSRTSSTSSAASPRSTIPRPSRNPMLSPSSVFLRSNSPSPQSEWTPFRPQVRRVPGSFLTEQSQHVSPVSNSIAMTDVFSPPSSRQPHILFPQPPTHTPTPYNHHYAQQHNVDGGTGCTAAIEPKSRTNNFFGLKFFPRSPSPTRTQARAAEETKSPAAKFPPPPNAFTYKPIAGAENATGAGSGITMGRAFDPPQQTSSSSSPDARSYDANDKSCRSLVAYDKKLVQTTHAEGGGSGAGGRRGETKHCHDSVWFGTKDGKRRSRGWGFGTDSSQVDLSRASVDPHPGAGSGMNIDAREAHQQNSTASSSLVRQSRFSVGRRNRREQRSRSPRHWFVPGRFFASAGAVA